MFLCFVCGAGGSVFLYVYVCLFVGVGGERRGVVSPRSLDLS